MNLSQILKELRKENNVTHKQLAEHLGYSDSLIEHWEKGTREPTLRGIRALAKFFDVSADYLLGLEDEYGNKL